MSRRPIVIRQSDLTAVLKAMTKAGIEVRAVEFDISGKVVITTSAGQDDPPRTDLDRWLVKHADGVR
jgi:hypothetical protein